MSSDRRTRIEQRAREIWEREGRPDGRADMHWRQAEQEIEREEVTAADTDSGPAGPAPLTSTEPAEGSPEIGPEPKRGGERSAQQTSAGEPTTAKNVSAPVVAGASAPSEAETPLARDVGSGKPAVAAPDEDVSSVRPVVGGASVPEEVAEQAKAVRREAKVKLPDEKKKAAGKPKSDKKKG